MDRLRYPIGRFEPIEHPTPEDRGSFLREITEFPQSLRLAVECLTPEQLGTPYRTGGWTVRQVVHHVADNDMHACIRFKRALTEDSPIADTYREALWAELADSREEHVEPSLLLIEALRLRFAALLRSLEPDDFRRTVRSPTHGPMSLEIAMQRFAWHGRHHLAQIVSLKERSGW